MAVIEGNFLYILKTRQHTDHKKYSSFRVKLPKKYYFPCCIVYLASHEAQKPGKNKLWTGGYV